MAVAGERVRDTVYEILFEKERKDVSMDEESWAGPCPVGDRGVVGEKRSEKTETRGKRSKGVYTKSGIARHGSSEGYTEQTTGKKSTSSKQRRRS